MWYVLEGFREHLAELAREKFNVIIMDIQQPAVFSGLAFPEEEAERILAKIGLTGPPLKTSTDMDGVTLLRFNRGQRPESPIADKGFSVSISSWRGDTDYKPHFKDAVAKILLPVVKKNIEIHAPHQVQAPLADGIFRVFICSSSMDADKIIRMPGAIFNIPVQTHERPVSYEPSDRAKDSLLIVDEDTGYAPAQIVGDNLYVHYDICRRGVNSEYQIFKEILTRAAQWLQLSPEECLARQQKLAEERALGRVSIESWRDADEGQARFIKAVREILLPAIKKDAIIHVPHESKARLIRDGRFHIFIWSTIPENSASRVSPPEKIFGLTVDCMGGAFQPSGTADGVVITDGHSDYAVAELFESNLFIHHHICCKGETREAEMFKRLLKVVVKELSITPAERAEQKKRLLLEIEQRDAAEEASERARLAPISQAARPLYIAACADRFPAIIKEMTKTFQETNDLVGKLSIQLIFAIKNNRHAQSTLKLLTALLDEEQRAHNEEFSKILALPGVLGVFMEGNQFKLYTDVIRITHEDVTRVLGQFLINIWIHSEHLDIFFKNLSNCGRGPGAKPPEGFDADPVLNWHHPYVDKFGRAKLGQLEMELPQFLGKNDYFSVVKLILQFLRTVDPSDYAGRGLKFWPQEKTAPIAAPAPKRKRASGKQLSLPVST